MRCLTLLLFLVNWFGFTQNLQGQTADTTLVQLNKTEGGYLIGKIIYQDTREVFFQTQDGRNIYVPQHTISSIQPLNSTSDISEQHSFRSNFSTRYFITTNGLSLKKGENYVLWNLYGPDFQFGIRDNFSFGILTSWLGIPVIATLKKSFPLGKNLHAAIGGLFGTGSWVLPEIGGALPFGSLTLGNSTNNLTFSGGYGAIWAENELQGRALSSIAGTIRLSDKFSLVFDSFILFEGRGRYVTNNFEEYILNPVTGEYEWIYKEIESFERPAGIAIVIPGIRWHQGPGKSFQFGFSALITDGEAIPLPIPMVQWFRSL